MQITHTNRWILVKLQAMWHEKTVGGALENWSRETKGRNISPCYDSLAVKISGKRSAMALSLAVQG